MNFFRADLHCHSTCSDGTLTPRELLLHAKERNLNALSITDHDTVAAYPQVFEIAKSLDLLMIPGVEFSAVQDGVSVHILGYCFQIDHPAITALCQRHSERRRSRNLAILALLNKSGIRITEEEILAQAGTEEHKTIGRPHIAMAMMKRSYVATVAEAFRKYIGEGRPCFTRGDDVSVEETLNVIHAAGGLAVIAHPHLVEKNSVVRKLVTMPFDGMECYYGNMGMKFHDKWLRLAKEKEFMVTGGSDFHGSIKPAIPLGCSWTPEETFRLLLSHYESCKNK